MRRSFLALGLVSFVGCGDSSPGQGTDEFKHDHVFTMTLTVPSGEELHQCQLVQVPKGADIHVNRFAHEYTTGSHHFLLYLTDLTSIPSDLTGQYDCTNGDEPVLAHSRGIVYGAQKPTGEVAFPEDVAMTLKGGQVLVMNTHYLNAGADPLETTVKVGLDVVEPANVKQEGGFFIFYDPFIAVPPLGKASSGGGCYVGADVNVVSAFTHYHYRGTGMKLFQDVDGKPQTTKPFFSTNDWLHPDDFEGPAKWNAGDRIRYQCDYENLDKTEVFQGPNAKTSEMCVFAGLYYPKQENDFEFCDRPQFSGFGSEACLSVTSCIQTCPASDALEFTSTGAIVGPCWQRCVASGCDGATDGMLDVFACAASECPAECSGDGADCIGCVNSKCHEQFSACASHSCK